MALSARLKALAVNLLPPIITTAIRGRRPDPHILATDAFYGGLLPSNCLCFDVGANVGNRTASFRRLGFRVVAVEPQPRCYSILKASFGEDSKVVLINKGLGTVPGKATMMLSDHTALSTFSRSFIDATTKSGRFEDHWNKTAEVEITTLDALVESHGTPDFIKIDVEGFELEVIRGLSRPVDLIALEWTPELTDTLIGCVAHLSRLGPISCNLSWGESMKLARKQWFSHESLDALLNQFREETYLFGDVYVRTHRSS